MPGKNDMGPFGPGVQETYDDPTVAALGDSGETTYSWFKDCSSPTTPDGTRWTAQWANRILKQLRRACDGMGIARNEQDGDRLLKAILKADRPVSNVGTGVGVYKGDNETTRAHELRSIKGAGTIGVTANEDGTEIIIDGESGDIPTVGIGEGVPVFAGLADDEYRIRSLTGGDGVETALNVAGDEIDVKLAVQDGWSLMAVNSEESARPAGINITALTEEEDPADNDWVLLGKNADGALRKVTRDNLLKGGGKRLMALVTFEGDTGGAFAVQFGCTMALAGDVATITLDEAMTDYHVLPMLHRAGETVDDLATFHHIYIYDKTSAGFKADILIGNPTAIAGSIAIFG